MEVLDKKKKYVVFIGSGGNPFGAEKLAKSLQEFGFQDVSVHSCIGHTKAQFFEVK